MKQNRRITCVLCLAFLSLCLFSAQVFAANIIIINLDGPGVGLNDPTPVAPVGGNPGVTLGAQRGNVYALAAQLWGATLDSSADIFVGARFIPLPCSATGAVLGSAGTTFIVRDFPGAQFPLTWYHSSLGDALAGGDLIPGQLDIISSFNSAIDNNPACLAGRNWYYGFDNNEGSDVDFLSVVAHEIAHGLGFSNFINEATGAGPQGLPDIYSRYTLDLTTGLTWDVMTNSERVASAINTLNVVWNGPSATAASSGSLAPRPSVQVLRPQSIQASYEGMTATFGPPVVDNGGTSGQLVLADDGVGVGSDACEPILNNVHGKIALVDRGSCAFTVKVANAQAAGAKGVVVANNVPKGLPPMGGTDPSIVIPSLGVTQADGNLLRGELPGANVKLILDADFGTGTAGGFVRLYAPDPVALGSSISHWDTSATPNLLMEPFINSDLNSSVTYDLTPFLLEDIGWVLLP